METGMPSKLDQLRAMTVVVADTGDLEAVRRLKPQDCTTNPTLLLKAVETPAYGHIIDEALAWGRSKGGTQEGVVAAICDRLAVAFGAELAGIVPGRVSTEVDADLSFDTEATIAKAREVIAAYAERGVPRERILIKIASTWEGIRAAERLQREGIDCNLTLLFSLEQAAACADAGVFLISPFVGRILDWHVKAGGGPYTGEIEALAGCDRLTISPALLDELAAAQGDLPRRLSPHGAAGAPARMRLDKKSFRFLLNEDAMAAEKLAEGIRQFVKDWRSLRSLVARRLEDAKAA